MDITLIPIAEGKYDKKLRRRFILDEGIVQLTDCCLVMLHKSGMRPLYLMNAANESILTRPNHKLMKKPDLILYPDAGAEGKQSAGVIEEQLKTCGCFAEKRGINFSIINKKNNINMLKNMLSTRIKQLEQDGYHHIVIVANPRQLDTIARCMNGVGLNQGYNIPVYSFSEGKEIKDENLIGDNFYITRELLDDCLIKALNDEANKELIPFKGKCHYPFEIYQLKKKLHIAE